MSQIPWLGQEISNPWTNWLIWLWWVQETKRGGCLEAASWERLYLNIICPFPSVPLGKVGWGTLPWSQPLCWGQVLGYHLCSRLALWSWSCWQGKWEERAGQAPSAWPSWRRTWGWTVPCALASPHQPPCHLSVVWAQVQGRQACPVQPWTVTNWLEASGNLRESMQHKSWSGNGYKLEKEREIEGRGASYATVIKATSSSP